MKNTIKSELAQHVLDCIQDGVLTDHNRDDWHYYAFNEDYYIIGYWEASQWLKKHGLDPFEAIGECIQYEKDNFGEVYKGYNNAEETVNMLVYIYGEEIFAEVDAENIADLEAAIKELI